MRAATPRYSCQVVGDFLEFFDETGIDLLRDEEEWVFRSLRHKIDKTNPKIKTVAAPPSFIRLRANGTYDRDTGS